MSRVRSAASSYPGLLGEMTGGFTERQPQNVPEEYVRTIGEFLPSAAMFGGVNPLSLFAGGVGPALTSETAGQAARKFAPEGRPEWMPDWVPDAETVARIGGAFLSPLGLKAGQKVITPYPTSKTARIRAAKYFEKENIPYTAGQKTGAKTQQYRESETGGAAYADFVERQQLAFNRAALKRIGSKADEASPDVMIEAHDRIGKMFTRLANRNSIQPQNQLNRDLRDTVRTYYDKVGKPNRAPIVEKTIMEITDAIAKGRITGQQYQSLITRLREAGQGANADLSMVTRGLRKNLDDAMERSIAQNNPGDLGAWKVARSNWRDLNAIEDTIATGAGGTEGMINPTKLHQVTTGQGGKRAAAQGGKNDLAELAAHGKTLMKSIAPDSGTASRLVRRMGGAVTGGGATGGAIGGLLGGPIGAAIGTAGGMAAGPILSSLKSGVTMSKPMQKYLGNTLLKKPAPSILGDKPAGGLLRILEQEQASERAGEAPPLALEAIMWIRNRKPVAQYAHIPPEQESGEDIDTAPFFVLDDQQLPDDEHPDDELEQFQHRGGMIDGQLLRCQLHRKVHPAGGGEARHRPGHRGPRGAFGRTGGEHLAEPRCRTAWT